MKQQKLWTRNFIMVMISNFAASFSHNCFTTVIALYINDIGGTNQIAGLVAGGLTFVMMVTVPIFGNVIDRTGRRTMAVIGAILFALNTIVYNFVFSLPVLIVVRVLHGLSQGMFVVATSTLVADIIPEERLTEGLGIFGVSANLAGVLGPITGITIYKNLGPGALFIFMSILATAGAVAAILIKLPEQPRERVERVKRSIRQKFEAIPKFVIGLLELSVFLPGIIGLFNSFGYSSVQNFLTTCGEARSIPSVGVYFTVCSCSMIVTRLTASVIARHLKDKIAICISLLMIAGSLIVISAAYSLPMLIVAGVLYGLGAGLFEPIIQTLVFTLCSKERRGAANATYRLLRDIGTGVGSAVWGGATMHLGYTMTFLLSAGCIGAALIAHLLFLYRRMGSDRVPKAQG